jgi:hypothetical protein
MNTVERSQGANFGSLGSRSAPEESANEAARVEVL